MAIIILPNIPSYAEAKNEALKAQAYYSSFGFCFKSIGESNNFTVRDKTNFHAYAKLQICEDIDIQIEINIRKTETKQQDISNFPWNKDAK